MFNIMRALTAELFGSPVVGFATSMDTLSGELRHSVAKTKWICMSICAIAAVAEVRNTSRSEGGNVQQTMTAFEGWSSKDLLTQRFLQNR